MKVKTLRLKETKEFIHILEGGQVGTSAIPDILADTASMENLKLYYESAFAKKKINYDEFEVVEFDLIEAGEVGPDIRNKLSPPLNLVALLEDHLGGSPDGPIEKLIRQEMEQTKVSIEYLSKLF